VPYIGRQIARGQNRKIDDVSSSFNGGTATFNLRASGDPVYPATTNQLFVSVGGVMQDPGTDFTVAGDQVTFTTAPAAGLSFFALMQGDAVDTNTPGDGTVTTSKIGNDQVTTAKIGDDQITGAKLADNITISTTSTISDAAGNLRDIPQNAKTGAYVLLASDAGKHISITTGGVTVNASVFSVGDAVSIYNNSGSNQTVTQGTSVTLRLAGDGATGNKTLAGYGLCTVLCVASNQFVIAGSGIS
jgi:hypothetical protein|tara:strand:- start:617 stop:1351 length:735 start_codon:yes stop_codon:yes gene_type:complete